MRRNARYSCGMQFSVFSMRIKEMSEWKQNTNCLWQKSRVLHKTLLLLLVQPSVIKAILKEMDTV